MPCKPAIHAFANRLERQPTVVSTRVGRDPTPYVQATIESRHVHPDVEELVGEKGFAIDLRESDVRIGDHATVASVRFVPYRVLPQTIE
ncbi:hypothetical protein [Natronorarus salvus]|uniref:hypothetical protein n=1 Tax=Natronorarus salvus TaxID=3117733 RepID=UPI002F2665D2